jgi:membrane fusion protein (multidrug efflux system)
VRRAALALALIAAAACGGEPPSEEVAAPPVTVATVEALDLDERLEATGELIAINHAQIAAEVAGRVTQVVLEEGSFAEAGAVVLEIDPERRQLDLENARADVRGARAALNEADRDVKRVRELHRRDIASQAQLDQAETGLRTARSSLEAAQARAALAERALRDASLRAPFAGTIAERHVSTGEFVNVGQRLFELVSVDPIEVEFHLAERDSGRVRLGQRVEVRLAPYPDERFAGEVTVVSPTIDPRSRTLRVRAAIPNEGARLRPGLFARVDLGLRRRIGVLMVPEEAILQRADGQVVFRLADGTVERRIVETAEHHEGRVEIVRGLSAGDSVVTRGHADLIDQMPVSVRSPDGSAPARGVATGPVETSTP